MPLSIPMLELWISLLALVLSLVALCEWLVYRAHKSWSGPAPIWSLPIVGSLPFVCGDMH